MRLWILLTIAFLGLGVALLPRGAQSLALIAGPRDEVAVADFTLAAKRPADYERAIAAALAEQDEDLAASLLALADERGLAVAGSVRNRVAAAEAEARSRLAGDAWNGFLFGDAQNEAALAGATAGDLTGIGDVRDLYGQAENFITGEEIDPLLAGLSAVGLGVTVATYASAGMALPARSGLSTVKAVKRAGKLSPALARQLGVLAADAVDKRSVRLLARSLDGLGTDIFTIGSKAGYRTTLLTLEKAQSVKEVSMMAKLATRFGKATRGAVVLAGGVLTFASVMGTAVMWSLSLLLWALAGGMALTRLSWRIGRWLWKSNSVMPAKAGILLPVAKAGPQLSLG
jgi:hypothetical protein